MRVKRALVPTSFQPKAFALPVQNFHSKNEAKINEVMTGGVKK